MDTIFGGPILPVIFAGIMAFTLLAYVICDGFDLGVGMLFMLEKGRTERDIMVNTIAPVWDGNETWLVLGGAGLYGAFPAAYASVLPALYPLVFLMVLGLIFRGVAFEFRFRAHTEEHRQMWDLGFLGGSLLAAFCQGTMAGGLIQGIKVANGQFAGAAFDFLTPFAIFCGIAVMIGYALLGACWLYWRTPGDLQERMRHRAHTLGVAMVAVIALATVWSGIVNPAYFHRWIAGPDIFFSALAPIALLLLGRVFFRHLRHSAAGATHDATPLVCGLCVFTVCFAGLGYSFFPMIVPAGLTIWQAAAPPSAQIFQLVGTCIFVPTIIAYNLFAYWVFRGKVEPGAHYH
jgi:cytochrome d ubiquinol oxidase subunit II